MPRIAAVQMCSSADLATNLASASQFIRTAAENGADLVVLPEMFALMGNDAEKLRIKEAFGSGPIQSALAEIAKAAKIWVVAGTIPIEGANKYKARAACLVFNEHGEVVARYDKMHLFDVTVTANESYLESNTIEPGDNLVVVETPVGKLGLAVCYDVRFPELFRSLFNRGAELFALPSAFTVKTGAAHWEVLLRSRAIENFSYVIGAGQGGLHANGRSTFGHSMIVEPWGSVIAKQEDIHPGVIYADINLNELHRIRQSIPIAEHKKIFNLKV
jgi:nitrilase